MKEFLEKLDYFKYAIDNGFKYQYQETYQDDYPGSRIDVVEFTLGKDLENNVYLFVEDWTNGNIELIEDEEYLKFYQAETWEEYKEMLNIIYSDKNFKNEELEKYIVKKRQEMSKDDFKVINKEYIRFCDCIIEKNGNCELIDNGCESCPFSWLNTDKSYCNGRRTTILELAQEFVYNFRKEV